MPAPSSQLVTRRNDLGESMREFDLVAQMNGFIAKQVLPVFDVEKQAGQMGLIPVEQLAKYADTMRAPKGGYVRRNWTFTKDTFNTTEYGIEEVVDENEAAMYSDFFNAEQVAAERCQFGLLLGMEVRAAAAIFNTSTWTGATLTTAVSTAWTDTHNANVVSDVLAARRKVHALTGIWPNSLIVSEQTRQNIARNDQVIDAVRSSGAGSPTKESDMTSQMLSNVLGVGLKVGGTAYDSAAEGATASIASVWSNSYAMICHIANGNDFRAPCIGRMFHWNGDGSSIDGTYESYEEPQTRGTVIRLRNQVQEKITYKECGHLLSGIA